MLSIFGNRYIFFFLCFVTAQRLSAQISIDASVRTVFANAIYEAETKTSSEPGLFDEAADAAGFGVGHADQKSDIQINGNGLTVVADGSQTAGGAAQASSSLLLDFSLANTAPFNVEALVKRNGFGIADALVSLENLSSSSTVFSIALGSVFDPSEMNLSTSGFLPAGSYRLSALARYLEAARNSSFHVAFTVGTVPETGSTLLLTAFGSVLAFALRPNKKAAHR